MAIEADSLPREGANSQALINNMSEYFGNKNTMDVIMSNLPSIAMQVGAKKPDFHPEHQELNFFGNQSKNTQIIKKDAIVQTKLHTPIQTSEKPSVGFFCQDQLQNYNIPLKKEKPSYFKDALGNQYKISNGELFVIGWYDTNAKIRLVNEKTGKEISTSGKKFQIYGWHSVNKIDDKKDLDAIKSMESEVVVDNIENEQIEQCNIEKVQSQQSNDSMENLSSRTEDGKSEDIKSNSDGIDENIVVKKIEHSSNNSNQKNRRLITA